MSKVVGNVSGQANDITVATGSGVIDTDTQRVVLATDQPVIPINDNGGSITVDGTVAVSGTTAVSAASLPLPSGAATAAKQPALGTAGVASTDVITVQGIASGVAQPVSGTVTANAGTGTMAVSIATAPVLVAGSAVIGKVGIDQTTPGTTNLVAANNTQINGIALSTGTGASGTGTQRVVTSTDSTIGTVTTVSTVTAVTGITNALPAGTNAIGKLAANSGVIIGDVNLDLSGVAVSSGVGASGTGTIRTVMANGQGRTLLSAGGSASTSGNNTLVAAGTNKLKVYAFSLTTTSTTAMTCIFQSGASGTELWRCVLQAVTGASTGANLSVAVPSWLFATASATLLNLNLSSANAVHWSVSYYDEA